MTPWLFYLFAVIIVGSSLAVVGQRNPMHSVMFLIGSFIALAGLYVGLDSPFVAVTQIVIYAGAIMVLFLFVVMLLNVPTETPAAVPLRARISAGPRRFGAVLAGVLVIELAWAFHREPMAAGWSGTSSTVHDIGLRLFREYAFAFEATSVLILVAMVGAVVLARREPR